jgi:hypothetical protein
MMKRLLLALVASVLAVAGSQGSPFLPGATPGQSAPAVDDAHRVRSPGTVIRGRVVGSDTGTPVGDAAVSIVPLGHSGAGGRVDNGRPGRSTPVDAAGRFEIDGLAPGYYRLVASPGTTSARYLTTRFPDPRVDDPAVLTVTGEGRIEGIEIRLLRAAVITGQVIDERGIPVTNVAVSARTLLLGNRPGAERHPAILPVMTDDTGNFRLFGLPAGDYLIHARPMVGGHVTMMLPNAETITRYGRRFAPAYYPASQSIAGAVPVRVSAGDTYGPILLSLAESRVYTVRGMLFDSTGHPASNVPVLARSAETARGLFDAGMPMARPVLDDGTFEIAGLAPGEYYVGATRFLGETREAGWTALPVYDDLEGIVLRLQPGATVRGQVLFEGRTPPSLSNVQVQSVPVGPVPVDAVTTRPDDNGVFLLPHQFGPTLVRVDGLRGWHLKAVLHDGEDITDRPVTFVDRGPHLQIVLADRSATISGVVRTAGGSPVDAAVLLVSDDPDLFHEHSKTTRLVEAGGDGVYRVEGLRAGRYVALAVDRDEPSLTGFTRAYFDLILRHGTAIVVHDGETVRLDLTVWVKS